MKTLYISDLDGTLLQDDASLSDYSRTCLQKLIYNGLPFTVASARSVVSMKSLLTGLRLNLPVIEFNGAFISDLSTGRHHIVNAIKKNLAEEIYDMAVSHGQRVFVSTFDGLKDRLYYCDIVNNGMKWYLEDRQRAGDERLCFLTDLKSAFNDQIVCLTIIGDEKNLKELVQKIENRFKTQIELHYMENQYSPGWYWLTVHDLHATKDQAIDRLMKDFGMDDYHLTVFGDNDNDIKMFQAADRAIAVSNAKENLISYADQIIGSNHEDAVVCFIEQEWLAQ